jgi:hypothetical protein
MGSDVLHWRTIASSWHVLVRLILAERWERKRKVKEHESSRRRLRPVSTMLVGKTCQLVPWNNNLSVSVDCAIVVRGVTSTLSKDP